MDFKAMLSEFTDALVAGDSERFACLFAEDGVYHDVAYGTHRGRGEIRAMVERVAREGESYRFEMRDPVSDGQLGYARFVFSFTTRHEAFAGKRVVTEGMGCFELEEGLIKAYHEATNQGIGLAQLGIAPEHMAKIFARKAERQKARPELRHHFGG